MRDDATACCTGATRSLAYEDSFVLASRTASSNSSSTSTVLNLNRYVVGLASCVNPMKVANVFSREIDMAEYSEKFCSQEGISVRSIWVRVTTLRQKLTTTTLPLVSFRARMRILPSFSFS